MIFNGLFKYDKDGNIINDLASSYKFINNTTLIVNIKKNIKLEKKIVNEDFHSNFESIIKGRHYCFKLISLPLKIRNLSLRGDVTRYGYYLDGKWIPRLFDSECLFGLKYLKCKKDYH